MISNITDWVGPNNWQKRIKLGDVSGLVYLNLGGIQHFKSD